MVIMSEIVAQKRALIPISEALLLWADSIL